MTQNIAITVAKTVPFKTVPNVKWPCTVLRSVKSKIGRRNIRLICKEIRRLQKNISTAVKEEEKEVMDSNSSNIEQIKSEIDPLDGPVTSESGVTFISQKRLRITSLYDSKSCGGCGKGQVGLRRCKRC